MKQSFILLSIAIALLSLSDATEFLSPSQPPVISPIQSPVMSPTSEPSKSDCSSVTYSMVDCLSFLTLGSTDPTPTKTCCAGVKSVLEFNPQCLCSGLESSRAMGFVLDDKKALAIPKTCNVPIDPHCDLSTPAAQPALPPLSPSVEPPMMTSPSSTKSPVITPSLPTATPSPPVVTPSPPTFTHSPPAVTASSPTMPVSSSTRTVSSPKVTASSPAPSPSISSTETLSLSKLFLAVTIVSSFSYMLA